MSQPQPEERKKTDSKLDPSDTGTKASGIADTVTQVALSLLQETHAPTSNVPTDDEDFEIDSLIAKTSVPKETDESSSQGATQDSTVKSAVAPESTTKSCVAPRLEDSSASLGTDVFAMRESISKTSLSVGTFEFGA